MNPEALSIELEREPFEPLRLKLTDGRVIDITDPVTAVISNLSVYIFKLRRGRTHIADHTELVSLRHIVSIERLAPQGSGN